MERLLGPLTMMNYLCVHMAPTHYIPNKARVQHLLPHTMIVSSCISVKLLYESLRWRYLNMDSKESMWDSANVFS